MPRPPHPWRAHVGQLAWPTLLLAGVVLLGEGAVWAATGAAASSVPRARAPASSPNWRRANMRLTFVCFPMDQK